MCTVQQMQPVVEKLQTEIACLKQQFPTKQDLAAKVDKKLGESMRKDRVCQQRKNNMVAFGVPENPLYSHDQQCKADVVFILPLAKLFNLH